MTDDGRSIELSIEVPGTPEAVWQAIATGPGITSWYVPHDVESREDGAMSASFGPGMDVTGRVGAWEPPERVRFDPGDGGPGLAFEWTIEAHPDRGTCTVRLVNSGFGSGADWDDQYDGMTDGWQLFLKNLHAHLTHFPGETATASLPMAMWAGSSDDVWEQLTSDLGLPKHPAVGDHLTADGGDGLTLSGEVLAVGDQEVLLLVDTPCRGTAFLAVEGRGEVRSVSMWTYLYGDNGAASSSHDGPRWAQWLTARGVAD